MNSVAIIPARGGSKGIPNKNIIDFLGKPLLAWSIMQARKSGVVDEVYVSSQNEEILAVAQDYGAIPVKRPDVISNGLASSETALIHVLDFIKKETSEDPETVVFLQATSPLRDPIDIARAVHTFYEKKADSLFSDAILDDFTVWQEEEGRLVGKTFDPLNRGRRQDRPLLYLENGSIYVFKSSILRTLNNRLGGKICRYNMPFWKSFEIDTLEELELCKFYFQKNLLSYWKAEGNPFKGEDISLIVYDFDGVMTDNRAIQFQDGAEAVLVSRADGWGIRKIKEKGINQIILSTEQNSVVSERGKKLDIEVIQGSDDKKLDLLDYCARNKIDPIAVLYVGNDVNDLEVMKAVGCPVAPADAHPSVIAIAKYVAFAKGGEGVIRELSDYIV
ncbi:acylneuraminate cytidylyltransferase [bacterium]|nr:acylneuraminate cytidylyltransferase [bacterium]